MWVLMAALLRGFPFTRTTSPDPNPVLSARGERSEMELLLRSSHIRLFNPASGEMSDIELSEIELSPVVSGWLHVQARSNR